MIVSLWESLNSTFIDWRTDVTSTEESSNFSEQRLKTSYLKKLMELLRVPSILSWRWANCKVIMQKVIEKLMHY